MECEKCLYKDYYSRLETGYEIVAKDPRVALMECFQFNKKGERINVTIINYPRKTKKKLDKPK